MYEYRYVELETGGGFWFNNHTAKHRQLIDDHAAQGWRYVGFIPLTFTANGGISSMELIFERPREE